MDYLEMMNFCGYDLDKANKMAQKSGAKTLPEVVEEIMRETGLERKSDDVPPLQSKSIRRI